jgi:cytochrome c oxidase subunit 2
VAATVVLLFVFLFPSVGTGRAIASLGSPHAMTIAFVGHQWWWEVQYSDPVASNRITTANEIHIPVGEPVVLNLSSRDVIHSFWVPALHGKRDLLPGYETAFWIEAQYPGVYAGKCAEYCGEQHAHMAIQVLAEPRARFEEWLRQQRQPAPEPATDAERRGREVFLQAPCTQCHTIRGTSAGATVAPDLTHLATRLTLAAGTIPNTTGHLAGWVLDSQQVKPGNHMPPNGLKSEDLQALLAYLRSLR